MGKSFPNFNSSKNNIVCNLRQLNFWCVAFVQERKWDQNATDWKGPPKILLSKTFLKLDQSEQVAQGHVQLNFKDLTTS